MELTSFRVLVVKKKKKQKPPGRLGGDDTGAREPSEKAACVCVLRALNVGRGLNGGQDSFNLRGEKVTDCVCLQSLHVAAQFWREQSSDRTGLARDDTAQEIN